MMYNNHNFYTMQRQFINECQSGNLLNSINLFQQNNFDNLVCEYAFRYACENGHLETAKWVLSVKPSINISADEEYVFRDACENGHLETAKFLLSVNPSINIRVYERANLKNHFNNNTNIIFLNLFTFQTPILHIIK